MRRFIAGLFLLFLSNPALAEPPAPYEYIVSYKLGRGLPVCDAVFGQLVNPMNALYLRYRAGAPVNDSGKGETIGMFSLTGDSAVSLPVWHWDGGSGDTLLDLDGDNRKEKIYSTLGPLGDFPHLSMNDNSALAASLASLQGSYIIKFEYRPYVIARQFGRLQVYQLWKSNAPLETRLCEFVTSAPVEGTDIRALNVAIPLDAVNYHDEFFMRR